MKNTNEAAKGEAMNQIKSVKGETVKIGNIVYKIEQVLTIDDQRAAGRGHVVTFMEKIGSVADLILRRPNGKINFLAREYNQGAIQGVVLIVRL